MRGISHLGRDGTPSPRRGCPVSFRGISSGDGAADGAEGVTRYTLISCSQAEAVSAQDSTGSGVDSDLAAAVVVALGQILVPSSDALRL